MTDQFYSKQSFVRRESHSVYNGLSDTFIGRSFDQTPPKSLIGKNYKEENNRLIQLQEKAKSLLKKSDNCRIDNQSISVYSKEELELMIPKQQLMKKDLEFLR